VTDFGDLVTSFGEVNIPRTAARIRTLDEQGIVRTLVGPGGRLYANPDDPDGIGMPMAFAFDSKGNLAVVDTRNNSVRVLSARSLR
jgi:hypothetical protein